MTTPTLGTSQLRIVCVFSDPSQGTKSAEESLNHACNQVKNVTLVKVHFEKLDFGETRVLDLFYAADVVVVDVSTIVQQRTLFYHMGVRESFGKEKNIVLYNDSRDPEITSSLTVCWLEIIFVRIFHDELKYYYNFYNWWEQPMIFLFIHSLHYDVTCQQAYWTPLCWFWTHYYPYFCVWCNGMKRNRTH